MACAFSFCSFSYAPRPYFLFVAGLPRFTFVRGALLPVDVRTRLFPDAWPERELPTERVIDSLLLTVSVRVFRGVDLRSGEPARCVSSFSTSISWFFFLIERDRSVPAGDEAADLTPGSMPSPFTSPTAMFRIFRGLGVAVGPTSPRETAAVG